MNAVRLLVGSLIVAALVGCASSSSPPRTAEHLKAALLGQDDPETVRAAAPAFLLLTESMIAESPDNPELLLTGAELSNAYAALLVDPERRRRLSNRAFNYASRALCVSYPEVCETRDGPFAEFAVAVDKVGGGVKGGALGKIASFAKGDSDGKKGDGDGNGKKDDTDSGDDKVSLRRKSEKSKKIGDRKTLATGEEVDAEDLLGAFERTRTGRKATADSVPEPKDKVRDEAKTDTSEETDSGEGADAPDETAANGETDTGDLDRLYIFATTWAGWLETNTEGVTTMEDLRKLEYVFDHLLKIEPGFQSGRAQLYAGALASLRRMDGRGNLEKARQHFEQALRYSNRRDLMVHVEFARRYARQVNDRALHDRLLSEVIAADPQAPGLTLSNSVAQAEAENLLAEDYFYASGGRLEQATRNPL